MTPYRLASRILVLALPITLANSAFAGDDAADKKTIDAILQEIELVPSLYARSDGPVKFKALPKFSAKKMAEYSTAANQPVNKERERYQANRAKYAKEFPLRVAIFDAADEMEKTKKLDIRMVLFRPITPMKKAVILQEQAAQGMAIFKLEQILAALKETEKQRNKEKSKRWQANYDFALTRLEADLIFPNLGEGDDGWRLTFQPRILATEAKAKDYTKANKKHLEKIQADYADTPWAHVAARDSQRSPGMEWAPKKKK
jgi:hypothetical protein